MIGAATAASTAMVLCWSAAVVDIAPGGMCGFHTSQMIRTAAIASGSQIRKIRRP